MPRNGTTGVFTRTDGTRTGTTVWTQAKNAAVKIVSGGHDTHDQDIATALNDCLTQDNKIKPTASFLPNADGTLDLGSSSVTWNNQYLKGKVHLIDGQNDGVRFYNGANYVEIKASGSLAADYSLVWPTVQGTAGQTMINDGTGILSWQTNAGGDVAGPASAVDNRVASFDGTTGKLIKDSGVLSTNITTASSNVTAGNLVYGSDGAKGLIGLASGTSGQILQSQTSGSPPLWVNRSDGRVFISATALNGTSTTVITTALGTTYDMFEVILEDIVASSANSTATIDFTNNAGSSWGTSTFIGYDIDGTPAATTAFMDDIDQASTANINHCIVKFSRLCRSSSVTMAGMYDYFNAIKRISGTLTTSFGSGSNTANGIRIVGSSNLTGNVYLYGIRKS